MSIWRPSSYETVKILTQRAPQKTIIIGSAGARLWTVATYMIAGQGTLDQVPAHCALREQDVETFERSSTCWTDATIEYLAAADRRRRRSGEAFDSWAGP
jgi:uroporphyrinogen decarboxylase